MTWPEREVAQLWLAHSGRMPSVSVGDRFRKAFELRDLRLASGLRDMRVSCVDADYEVGMNYERSTGDLIRNSGGGYVRIEALRYRVA